MNDLTTIESELLNTITGGGMRPADIRHDTSGEEDPIPWSVWDLETGDILGAGDSRCEALEDAARTVRQWEES